MMPARSSAKKSQELRKKKESINNKIQKNLVGNKTIQIRGQAKKSK